MLQGLHVDTTAAKYCLVGFGFGMQPDQLYTANIIFSVLVIDGNSSSKNECLIMIQRIKVHVILKIGTNHTN